MRKTSLSLWFLSFCLLVQAQSFREYQSKTFNWGAKVGFNSNLPIINSFTLNGNDMKNINTEYNVGSMFALFCRLNINRFFIQPGLAIQNTKSRIHFNFPDELSMNLTTNEMHLKMKKHSVNIPVLIGYNIVKDGPYALSFMVGPNIKYNYKTSYTWEEENQSYQFQNDNSPWGISFVTGVSVSVWRLFFDFNYEFGINKTESDFKQKGGETIASNTILIHKRENLMSFSLGFLF